MLARSAARPKSPATRIGRLGKRSTHTPAGSVNRMKGRNSTVPSAATWKAVASRTSTAVSGMASSETCVPNWLTVSADQSLRKSAWRQRPPVGQPTLRIALLVERDGQRVGLPRRRLRGEEVFGEALEAPLEAGDVVLPEPGLREPEADGL